MASAAEISHFGDRSPEELRKVWARAEEHQTASHEEALRHRTLSELGKIIIQDESRNWMSQAACKDIEEFHFQPTWYERKDEKMERIAKAKAICSMCLVRQQCLDYAVSRKEPHGIWGGMTTQERKELE